METLVGEVSDAVHKVNQGHHLSSTDIYRVLTALFDIGTTNTRSRTLLGLYLLRLLLRNCGYENDISPYLDKSLAKVSRWWP
jgi:hypothetical protein